MDKYAKNPKRISSALVSLWSFLFLTIAHAETNPSFYAVQVSASVSSSPARITLQWQADGNATGYTVSRKAFNATSWNTIGSVGGGSTSYADNNVAVGSAFEYSVIKTTSAGYQGTGYLYAGIEAPVTEYRGKVLLIVDNTYAAQLATELTRMQQDLIGDGWGVIRHDVSRNDSVVSVKNLIRNDYYADPANVKSVFLFGHVPVPYSGDYNADQHKEHQGACPADVYYGDVDGNWTDS
ncbi:MAG: hypothetical protein JWM99_4258, partial [Verrucomicrobiales bacterium]|nr:hypothetical protein [Verrucomicrobiales bacterium]